tara:strand:- start:455 stop:628 length:174 start_codon:yes stop_codon:yes gene_type:complete
VIDSPCNDICAIVYKSGLCLGCSRTQDEIKNWLHYSDDQKIKVLKDLKRRNNIDNKG